MNLLDLIFGKQTKDVRKKVFISFAIEDLEYRNFLVAQAKNKRSPFDFIDMSAKKAWKENEWKERCRAKIRRCDGVIALLSKHTHKAGGARWEMKCAREERIKMIGMHIKKNNQGAIPIELRGIKIITWSWENLEQFIKQL